MTIYVIKTVMILQKQSNRITTKAYPPRKQPAANLLIAPKIHFSEMHMAGSRLLFRPDLIIAQLPHEYFLVYGLPGVVEHR